MILYDAPAWRVTLDGRDLTGTIAPRLISMTITECRTEELDQLDIELSDHDVSKLPTRHGTRALH